MSAIVGKSTPPLNFPITELSEIAFSNNIDTISVCTTERPTLQALKYTTTPTPICDSIVMYTIDVCNIGGSTAFDVAINDEAPPGAALISSSVNTNGCAENNGNSYDIPADCCVSISLSYNTAAVINGYYGTQNVILSGPTNQTYVDYDGSQSSAEDVTINEENDNCPSTNIWFTKEVSDDEICDDGFLVYTYTIHNETSSVIQGARFSDNLPNPMEWVFKPYDMNEINIMSTELTGTTAEFIIDEIPAESIATFSMDAYTGDWLEDGNVSSSASIENVIDLENGGVQTIESNEVNTIVFNSEGFDCDSLATSTVIIESPIDIIVFPNPTTGLIKFKNLEPQTQYRMFNANGLLYEEGILNGQELELKNDGLNLIQLNFKNYSTILKVVKL